jgi:hypothetical protein
MTQEDSHSRMDTYLEELERTGFWGAVTLKFESGRLVHVREERNIKPAALPSSTSRSDNAGLQR